MPFVSQEYGYLDRGMRAEVGLARARIWPQTQPKPAEVPPVSGTLLKPSAAPRKMTTWWRWRLVPHTPAGVVITAAAALAVLLRVYSILRPGVLLGVAWYDDGVYFASALRLVNGALPYRDFVFAQPPGITLLLTPAALMARAIGTDAGMAIARILTLLASTACVVIGGLLVRHRGLLAVIVTCGLLAVYPASVTTSHTIFIEPWVAVFCLAGALAAFDRDRLAGGRRLLWGGVIFGFAGAIESWAIIPVIVVALLCLAAPRKLATFLPGAAAGFLVPVLPFALLAPVRFYQSVFIAQLVRVHQTRVPVWTRLQDLMGLEYLVNPGHLVLIFASLALVCFVVAASAGASLITRQPPPPLEWFGVTTAALVVVVFMFPPGFFFHFPAFFVPFLALAIALPASRALAAIQLAGRAGAGRWLQPAASIVAALAFAVFAVIQAGSDGSLAPRVPPRAIAAVQRVVPAGACVVTDQVSFTIAANRFYSSVPGCPLMIDPLGTDYALASGRDGLTGAGKVPAVAKIMRNAFGHAQYIWLAGVYNRRRIAWNPALRAYFTRDFTRVLADDHGDALYVRKG
jgi:alpha-1,2-mannosyltransferase